MRIVESFKFAIDGILNRKLRSLLVIVASVMAILLCSLVIFMYELDNYNVKKCDNILKYGINNTGYFIIDAEGVDEDTYNYFMNKIEEMDGIQGIGGHVLTYLDDNCFNGLISIQEDNRIAEPTEKSESFVLNNNNKFEVFCMDKKALSLYDIKVIDGELPYELDNQKDRIYMYLGYEYREIPVGTVFESENSNYVVAGILEKNSSIINEFLSNSAVGVDKYYWNLDYEAIVLDSNNISYEKYFSVREDSDIDTIKKEIKSISNKMGINVIIGELNQVIKVRHKEVEKLIEYIIQLLIITIIVVTITQACMLIVSTLSDMTKYSIMNAFGVTKKSIIIVVMLENFIKYILAICISLVGSIVYLKYQYESSKKMYMYAIEIFYNSVQWKVCLIFLIIYMIASILPIYEIHRKSLVSIVGGKRI